VVGSGDAAERGHDGVVDAADADGGVTQVDEGVREGSRLARAARRATVLPAPTSPVITPRACSLMHQLIRAAASAWAAWRCSMPGARSRPKGILVNP
jgi:hypothetical protein